MVLAFFARSARARVEGMHRVHHLVPISSMSDLWYKNAVIYALDVESFMDGNGDGVGDFTGLLKRLDYIASLGITCLWLLPFYPSPNRDDGYDIQDYYGIDPRLGTLGDFVVFTREARQRGIHVLVDLVVNHTSDQHPWFQAARRNPNSRFRDYYVWTDNPSPDYVGNPVFPGEQAGNWAYDSQAGAYYWHWFYEHQPDLNTGNTTVCEEIRKIMGFWLELGVSGFRLDAAPFLIRAKGLDRTSPEDPHGFLEELRSFVSSRRSDAVLLAEADVHSNELTRYLGSGNRMHLLFNFILNNYYFLALAEESSEPLVRGLRALPSCPSVCQWANFVRNHDELNLDKLSEEEREVVFAHFAPDPGMRIYGRGIRRRMPTMLGGDRRRIEMAYSLLFALPGIPAIRYGEEIGMGENLSLAGRMSVRTPMQWSDAVNGGFSPARPGRLVRPVIGDGEYGYPRVNVDDQRADPDSLLNFMSRLIRTRMECPELGWGGAEVLDVGDPAVFALRNRWQEGEVMTIHNLSGEGRSIQLPTSTDGWERAVDLIGDRRYEPLDVSHRSFELQPHGFRWLRCR
jgi:maltose alpha-D-glucosyltransferase / alpha-amylase